MDKHESQWTLYDSNVQTYRSNSLASQALLLAVGAFLYKEEYIILLITFLVAMFQMWYIWYRVIRVRTIISDFHKFNFLYNFSSFVNNEGDFEPNTSLPLTEETYTKNTKTRRKANYILANQTGIAKLKYNYRLTRVKLDIMLPLSFSFLWIIIILSRSLQFLKVL